MSDPTKEKIDFDTEVRNLPYKSTFNAVADWGRSIAERVEAQTIERLEPITGLYLHTVKRLYAQRASGEKG